MKKVIKNEETAKILKDNGVDNVVLTPEVPSTERFVKANEVLGDKVHGWEKTTISSKSEDNWLSGAREELVSRSYVLDLFSTTFVSLQYTIDDIEKMLKQKFSIVEGIDTSEKNQNEITVKFVPEMILKDPNPSNMLEECYSDGDTRINRENIPAELKVLTAEGKPDVFGYGDRVAMVLSLTSVVENLIVKSLVMKNKEDIENFMQISPIIVKNGSVFFALTIKATVEHKGNQLMIPPQNFTAANISMTFEEFTSLWDSKVKSPASGDYAVTAYRDPLVEKIKGSQLRFFKCASLLQQNFDDQAAVKLELLGLHDKSPKLYAPVIKLKDAFTQSPIITGNAFLDEILEDSADTIKTPDVDEVLSVYGDLTNRTCITYREEIGSVKNLYILPDIKKIAMVAIFGRLEKLKIGVTTEAEYIAINLQLI